MNQSNTRIEHDTNNGDTVVRTYEVNTRGHRIKASIDTNADGKVDRIETYSVTSEGHRIKTSFDTDADGTVDRIETYGVNLAGQQHTTSYDNNADGKIDRIEEDWDYDGTTNYTLTYVRNSEGVRRKYIGEINRDNDDTTDYSITQTYDSNGVRVIRFEYDDLANGIVNYASTYTYDAEGELTKRRVVHDQNDDGFAERLYIYTYVGGALAGKKKYFDSNADGTIDWIAKDDDGDGIYNHIRNLIFDSEGVRTMERIQIDDNDDGKVDRIHTHVLNTDGTRTETRIDNNKDGIWDQIRYHEGDDSIVQRDVFQILKRSPGSDSRSIEAVLTDQDNNGIIDYVQVGANAEFSLRRKYGSEDSPFEKYTTGLEDIRLHSSAASELTLTAKIMRFVVAQNSDNSFNANHELLIQGGDDDTVRLVNTDSSNRGSFVIRDRDSDGIVDTTEVDGKTYAIYDARWLGSTAGSVLIEEDVTVVLPV